MLASIVSALIAVGAPASACHLSKGDQAWLDQSMRA